jgi:hypothetical protein
MQIPVRNTTMRRDSRHGNRLILHEKAYRSRPGRVWGSTGIFNISKNLPLRATFLRGGVASETVKSGLSALKRPKADISACVPPCESGPQSETNTKIERLRSPRFCSLCAVGFAVPVPKNWLWRFSSCCRGRQLQLSGFSSRKSHLPHCRTLHVNWRTALVV